MAATRKLQGEIDRCLKKVSEGVDTFEDIWAKVRNAGNTNQKEKYEADLKKEIKKLQRLRDQIKSWIASGEIKDKSILMENRKLIETQMERFKVVERETKTKAYSKEGLGAAQKLDPAQKEKEEMQQWLRSSINQLAIQGDSFESEMEQLQSKGKKKLDKDKQERMDELKARLERHKFHIHKLEALLRMLMNESVEVKQIKPIKDNVEYYIESWKEPDFEDNEFIYDDIIGLDDVELSGVGLPSSATTDSNDTGGTPTSIISGSSPISSPLPCGAPPATFNHSSDANNSCGEADKRAAVGASKPVKPTPVRATAAPATAAATLNTSTGSILNYSSCATSTPSAKAASQGATPKAPPPPSSPPLGASNFAAVAASTAKISTSGDSNPSSVIPNVSQQTSGAAAIPAANGPTPAQVTTTVSTTGGPQKLNPADVTTPVQNSRVSPEAAAAPPPGTPSPAPDVPAATPSDKISIDGLTSLKSMAQQVIDRAGLESQLAEAPPPTPPHLHQQQAILDSAAAAKSLQAKSEAHIPPLLGVAPLGAVPLQKEHQQQFQLMESAFYHLPHPSDSERIRTYLPRNPYNTPSYYIQAPLAHSDTLEFYQRLGTETLFFVFYYMEGTKAQYLAAKALKKQSWRFHTKYMMWFQRHEEPKIINEEYEQGTYIYFDYEKWGQRKKEGFTFEYKYLEDRDLN
ncbi:CCR4-NOT transcription complex subunit 3 isoform X2 [Cylas formicarius]|uniref:CCR4-NOT transcription complex subunit 3 isoform X2 n=1 Tax=Cylas formicarius TaxID=197179 RepID=UPI002958DCF7|nr:CCR4-NOT transcription complex subunit 3 isoform X2 [Cylas formicarius]